MSSLKDIYLTGSSEKTREINDFYATPKHATEALLKLENFDGVIWECACGNGAISKVLEERGYKVISSDLVNRDYGIAGLDFLLTGDIVQNIITNPPFKQAQEFIEHALKSTTGKVVMLLKLNFLEGQKRNEFFKRTPLKNVYVFSKRLSFDKGNEKGKGNGLLAYAWYVWEHGYEGKPTIDWII